MRRPSLCPVCEKAIPALSVNEARPFKCPHCDELLRALRRPGAVGAWIVHIFLMLMAFTYAMGFTTQLALAAGIGALIALLNVVLNRLMGFELEPVGRIPLGGLDD